MKDTKRRTRKVREKIFTKGLELQMHSYYWRMTHFQRVDVRPHEACGSYSHSSANYGNLHNRNLRG